MAYPVATPEVVNVYYSYTECFKKNYASIIGPFWPRYVHWTNIDIASVKRMPLTPTPEKMKEIDWKPSQICPIL